MTRKKNISILISGRGSNMSALIEAAKAPDYPARIVGVISNNPNAPGLKTAQRQNIPTAIHQLKSHASKSAADAAISQTLRAWQTDIICLAGFMRILSDEFASDWKNKLINIHPSLLPKYKGLNTHQRALEAGDKIHGCTVHHVVAELDAGPNILQHQVPILPGDTIESLQKRVLIAEHQLYPSALALIAAQ